MLMLSRGKFVLGFIALIVCSLVLAILAPMQAFAAKVNMSPPVISLVEGQSQIITLTLDEPIICQVMDVTCSVVITPVSADPARLTVSGAPVTIPYTQWAQSVTFSVTAVDDQIYDGNLANAMTFTTQSNSEYYNGFVPSLNLTVLENEAAPAAEATLSPGPTLASSGSDVGFVPAMAVLFCAAAVAVGKVRFSGKKGNA